MVLMTLALLLTGAFLGISTLIGGLVSYTFSIKQAEILQ